MTAPAPAERVNLLAFERDIAAVFRAHGLTGQVDARELHQAGQVAGVTVSAFSYVRPEEVPAPRPEPHADPFAAAAEKAEAMS